MAKLDPRVKFLIVLCLSTLVMYFQVIPVLLPVTLTTLLLSRLMGVRLLSVMKRLRHFFILLLAIVVIQSLFRNEGASIVDVGGVTLLTDRGLILGAGYLCRVVVILFSGAIIGTSTLRQNLQGLTQLGIPYEFALMTGVGIRFLPMLIEEVRNAYLAMELRGIDLNGLPLRKRVGLVSQLFIPIIYGTLVRARKLSESIEARGFVIGQKRSSYYRLKFSALDYSVSIVTVIIFIASVVMAL